MSPRNARIVCLIVGLIYLIQGKDGAGWLLFIALCIDV